MPSLSVLIPPQEKERSSSRRLDNLSATEGSLDEEICLSPSWSQFGGGRKRKEKKRAEKETKDLEKQSKKDEESQKKAEKEARELEKQVKKEKDEENRKTAGKASKRLSKKPPAAMDTQRMPAALRRFSSGSRSGSQPTSTDNSRRSSREERRSSISSISSFVQRFSPVSAKSFSVWPDNSGPIVSDSAPQLPKLSGIETQSRRVSSSGSAILDDDEEHSYKKDLVDFAYRLRTLSFGKDRNVEPATADRISTPSSKSQQFVTPPTSQNNTDVDLPKKGRDTPVIPGPVKPASTERMAPDRQDSISKQDQFRSGNQYPGRIKPRSDEHSNEAGRAVKAQGHRADSTTNQQSAPGSEISPTLDTLTSQIMSSIDGSSYVHKQRMHQQQKSIASYEDQMALSDRMQLTNGYDSIYNVSRRWPPTPTDSTESIQKTPRTSPTRQGKSLERKVTFKDKGEDQHPAFPINKPRNSTATGKLQSSGAFKADKTQDVQRRPKLEALSVSSESTDTVTAGQSRRNPYSPTSPPSPVSPISVVLPSKPEREFKIPVPNPLTMNPHQAKDDIKTREIEVPQIPSKYSIPDRSPKRATYPILASKILPRSSTTPNLTSTSQQTSQKPASKPCSSDKSPVTPSTTDTPTSAPHNENSSTDSPSNTSSAKPNLEAIIEGVNGDNLTRKLSLKRSRSNPQLQPPKKTLPSLDFLPELKHQPLTKPKRVTPATTPTDSKSSSYAAMSKFPLPSSVATTPSPPTTPSTLTFPPKPAFHPSKHSSLASGSPLRPGFPRRRTLSPSPTSLNLVGAPGPGAAGNNGLDVKPIAKMFVICCKCKFWHDLPSRLYEAMAVGKREIEEGDGVARSVGARNVVVEAKRKLGVETKGKEREGVETRVKCPWCEHGMSTGCCAGWTTVVYLHERHH